MRAVVNLARAFDVETIAEGAETPETVTLLRQLGVDYVQGYTIGHPEPLTTAFPPTTGVPR